MSKIKKLLSFIICIVILCNTIFINNIFAASNDTDIKNFVQVYTPQMFCNFDDETYVKIKNQDKDDPYMLYGYKAGVYYLISSKGVFYEAEVITNVSGDNKTEIQIDSKNISQITNDIMKCEWFRTNDCTEKKLYFTIDNLLKTHIEDIRLLQEIYLPFILAKASSTVIFKFKHINHNAMTAAKDILNDISKYIYMHSTELVIASAIVSATGFGTIISGVVGILSIVDGIADIFKPIEINYDSPSIRFNITSVGILDKVYFVDYESSTEYLLTEDLTKKYSADESVSALYTSYIYRELANDIDHNADLSNLYNLLDQNNCNIQSLETTDRDTKDFCSEVIKNIIKYLEESPLFKASDGTINPDIKWVKNQLNLITISEDNEIGQYTQFDSSSVRSTAYTCLKYYVIFNNKNILDIHPNDYHNSDKILINNFIVDLTVRRLLALAYINETFNSDLKSTIENTNANQSAFNSVQLTEFDRAYFAGVAASHMYIPLIDVIDEKTTAFKANAIIKTGNSQHYVFDIDSTGQALMSNVSKYRKILYKTYANQNETVGTADICTLRDLYNSVMNKQFINLAVDKKLYDAETLVNSFEDRYTDGLITRAGINQLLNTTGTYKGISETVSNLFVNSQTLKEELGTTYDSITGNIKEKDIRIKNINGISSLNKTTSGASPASGYFNYYVDLSSANTIYTVSERSGALLNDWRGHANYQFLYNTFASGRCGALAEMDMDNPLYIDAFGNILTHNGVVVVPAVNNASLYQNNKENYDFYSLGYLQSQMLNYESSEFIPYSKIDQNLINKTRLTTATKDTGVVFLESWIQTVTDPISGRTIGDVWSGVTLESANTATQYKHIENFSYWCYNTLDRRMLNIIFKQTMRGASYEELDVYRELEYEKQKDYNIFFLGFGSLLEKVSKISDSVNNLLDNNTVINVLSVDHVELACYLIYVVIIIAIVYLFLCAIIILPQRIEPLKIFVMVFIRSVLICSAIFFIPKIGIGISSLIQNITIQSCTQDVILQEILNKESNIEYGLTDVNRIDTKKYTKIKLKDYELPILDGVINLISNTGKSPRELAQEEWSKQVITYDPLVRYDGSGYYMTVDTLFNTVRILVDAKKVQNTNANLISDDNFANQAEENSINKFYLEPVNMYQETNENEPEVQGEVRTETVNGIPGGYIGYSTNYYYLLGTITKRLKNWNLDEKNNIINSSYQVGEDNKVKSYGFVYKWATDVIQYSKEQYSNISGLYHVYEYPIASASQFPRTEDVMKMTSAVRANPIEYGWYLPAKETSNFATDLIDPEAGYTHKERLEIIQKTDAFIVNYIKRNFSKIKVISDEAFLQSMCLSAALYYNSLTHSKPSIITVDTIPNSKLAAMMVVGSQELIKMNPEAPSRYLITKKEAMVIPYTIQSILVMLLSLLKYILMMTIIVLIILNSADARNPDGIIYRTLYIIGIYCICLIALNMTVCISIMINNLFSYSWLSGYIINILTALCLTFQIGLYINKLNTSAIVSAVTFMAGVTRTGIGMARQKIRQATTGYGGLLSKRNSYYDGATPALPDDYDNVVDGEVINSEMRPNDVKLDVPQLPQNNVPQLPQYNNPEPIDDRGAINNVAIGSGKPKETDIQI